MAIDFSRILRYRRGGTTYTNYGLTSAPSGHYLAFCSQNATRYIPLISGTATYLRARAGGTTYTLRGVCTYTIQVKFTKETVGIAKTQYKHTLLSVSTNTGGATLATSIKVQTLNSGASVMGETTVSLPANTSSKTYNTVYATWTSMFVNAESIKVTVTLNGKSVTTTYTIDHTPAPPQTYTITVSVPYAPW